MNSGAKTGYAGPALTRMACPESQEDTARFEKRNVLDAYDPTFDLVIQQNEIVTMKYGGLAFLAHHSGSRRLRRFFLDCH
jgi:hypothetical protein